MRRAPSLVLAAALATLALPSAAAAAVGPPYAITNTGVTRLQVFPTESGRYVQGETGLDPAWAEVVALDPTADSPGMREQFACHWRFARIVAPDKTSWNLEPWRPVVTDAEMVASRCNPGGAEEQIP